LGSVFECNIPGLLHQLTILNGLLILPCTPLLGILPLTLPALQVRPAITTLANYPNYKTRGLLEPEKHPQSLSLHMDTILVSFFWTQPAKVSSKLASFGPENQRKKKKKIGPIEDRTRDLLLTRQAHLPLSYGAFVIAFHISQ
jgi:hypothetical protein